MYANESINAISVIKNITLICVQLVIVQRNKIIRTEEPTADSTTLSTIVSPLATLLDLVGNNILLKIAVATILTSGIYVKANTLFDEGSQLSFITKSLADCLQLQTHGTEGPLISNLDTQTSHIRKLDITTI